MCVHISTCPELFAVIFPALLCVHTVIMAIIDAHNVYVCVWEETTLTNRDNYLEMHLPPPHSSLIEIISVDSFHALIYIHTQTHTHSLFLIWQGLFEEPLQAHTSQLISEWSVLNMVTAVENTYTLITHSHTQNSLLNEFVLFVWRRRPGPQAPLCVKTKHRSKTSLVWGCRIHSLAHTDTRNFPDANTIASRGSGHQ